MIIEFSVDNYLSFKDKVTFSMIGSPSDKLLDNNIINTQNIKILKSAIILGPNASGKTNLIKALNFMKNMVINSHNHQKGDILNISPFKLDEKYINKPSSFELIFIHNDIKYIYGFSLNKNIILNEYLYYYPKGKPASIFERWETNEFDFKKDKRIQNGIKELTLENTLYLSRSANLNYEKSVEVYQWFKDYLAVILGDNYNQMQAFSAKMYNENENFKKYIDKFLIEADTGINEVEPKINYFTKETTPDEAPEEFKLYLNNLKTNFSDMFNLSIKSFHNGLDKQGNKIKVTFDFLGEESSGTIKMFDICGPIFDVLIKGMTLIIDEFDIKLHPHLMRFIIRLFHDPQQNKNNAQLIFTSHNTYLLKPSIFRRDQIWFTNKRNDDSTEIYSLLEYKAKNGDNVEKRYLGGRYGAVPYLGDGDIL